jgi:general stress protein 26
MSQSPSSPEAERALDGAAALIAAARYCWLATEAQGGGVNARPMGRISPHPEKTGWTISFVTDGRSRKAAEMRRSSKATLIFQGNNEESYAALSGAAKLCNDRAETQRRWRAAYDAFFPTDLDRENAVFVDFVVERMDLWIKGISPEPFGLSATVLVREDNGGWRLDPSAIERD